MQIKEAQPTRGPMIALKVLKSKIVIHDKDKIIKRDNSLISKTRIQEFIHAISICIHQIGILQIDSQKIGQCPFVKTKYIVNGIVYPSNQWDMRINLCFFYYNLLQFDRGQMQKQQEISSPITQPIKFGPLSEIYSVQSVRKHVCRQLVEIQPHMYEVKDGAIYVTANLPLKHQQYAFNITNVEVITFSIVLGAGYPLHPPKVYLKTSITQPSINDCRDLLRQIIQEWKIRTSLRYVVNALPSFLKRLQELTKQIHFQKVGSFEIGSVYHFSFLKQLGGKEFLAYELTEQTIRLYIISQTETHFLLMLPSIQPSFVDQKLVVPKEQQIDKMTLIFMAQIQCLSQIKINKDQYIQYIFTFQSMKTWNQKLEPVKVVKKLKMADGFQLIGRILRCIRKYQPIEIILDTHPTNDSQQMLLLNEISKKEQELKQILNQETVKKMNQAYLAIVDYYSSQELPYDQIYLNKISQMYTRQEIKLLLKSQ